MNRWVVVVAAVTLQATFASRTADAQARLWEQSGACDRQCLIDIVDTYVAAMAARDPAAAPLARGIRFTENTHLMEPGDGLWATATAEPTTFRIYVPDPVARQVGFIGVMEEAGSPVQLGLRLKVEGDEITEAEHLVVRNLTEAGLANLRTPRSGLVSTIPPVERLPRELMLVIARGYYDALVQHDGDATLFDDSCTRHDNGTLTAGGDSVGADGLPRLGCRAQMFTRVFGYVDSIDLRRVWIADPETGLVFGLSQVRHSMRNREFTVLDREGRPTTRTVDFDPFDLPAAHVFKIRNGRIHEIEALGFQMPYMSRNGWSDFLR